MSQAEAMDKMYRMTRHVYDLSRKYYLLGRDRLLRDMDLQPGDHVLEIGCGTARNLIQLARLKPGLNLYGLDASQEMLNTAQGKVDAARLPDPIVLRQCLAEELDAKRTFGLDRPFDAVFFSYSLSMIPTWPQALDAAQANLKEGAHFYVVDFWDQGGWPGWFQGMLKKWLDLFHVHYRPEMLEHFEKMHQEGKWDYRLDSVAKRYAYIATFTTKSKPVLAESTPA